jgi:CO/xanthine dehydrogenase FAD-binding subunit
MTAKAAGELVTEVRVPAANGNASRTGHALVEFSRRHADFAVAGAAVAGNAIALFGVADTPVRAARAEQLLAGDAGAPAADVAAAATEDLEPAADVHGGSAYRRRVARACVERALRRARGDAP